MDLNKYLIFKIYLSSGVHNKVCHTLKGEDTMEHQLPNTPSLPGTISTTTNPWTSFPIVCTIVWLLESFFT